MANANPQPRGCRHSRGLLTLARWTTDHLVDVHLRRPEGVVTGIMLGADETGVILGDAREAGTATRRSWTYTGIPWSAIAKLVVSGMGEAEHEAWLLADMAEEPEP